MGGGDFCAFVKLHNFLPQHTPPFMQFVQTLIKCKKGLAKAEKICYTIDNSKTAHDLKCSCPPSGRCGESALKVERSAVDTLRATSQNKVGGL